MKMERFLLALKEDDFGIGDSFCLGNWEFEVVGIRGPNRVVADDDAIFRQVATKRQFVERIADSYPARLSSGHRDSMAVDEVLGELERAALYRLVSGPSVRAGSGRRGGEGSDSPSRRRVPEGPKSWNRGDPPW